MFLLNVSHAYVKELENFYFNPYTEMVRNYTLNGQNFVSLAAHRSLLVVIHHHKSYLVQVKKIA